MQLFVTGSTMKLIAEPIPGVKILEPFTSRDLRGDFVKPFHEGQLADHGLRFQLKEEFYTTSAAGVIRGMHFQTPPHAHQKMIYCISGRVLDVVVDIRKSSPTYGQFYAMELSAQNHYIIWISTGFAHGFASLDENSCLVYKTDHVHAPSHDAGISWNSFGFNWPFDKPVISVRDAAFPRLADFSSPF